MCSTKRSELTSSTVARSSQFRVSDESSTNQVPGEFTTLNSAVLNARIDDLTVATLAGANRPLVDEAPLRTHSDAFVEVISHLIDPRKAGHPRWRASTSSRPSRH